MFCYLLFLYKKISITIKLQFLQYFHCKKNCYFAELFVLLLNVVQTSYFSAVSDSFGVSCSVSLAFALTPHIVSDWLRYISGDMWKHNTLKDCADDTSGCLTSRPAIRTAITDNFLVLCISISDNVLLWWSLVAVLQNRTSVRVSVFRLQSCPILHSLTGRFQFLFLFF